MTKPDAGLAEFQSTSSLNGEVNWDWVAQQFAERDRLREEKRELVQALEDILKSDGSTRLMRYEQARTLLARVNAKEKM